MSHAPENLMQVLKLENLCKKRQGNKLLSLAGLAGGGSFASTLVRMQSLRYIQGAGGALQFLTYFSNRGPLLFRVRPTHDQRSVKSRLPLGGLVRAPRCLVSPLFEFVSLLASFNRPEFCK